MGQLLMSRPTLELIRVVLREALDLALVQNERGLPRVRRWFLAEVWKALRRHPVSGAPAWVSRFHRLIKDACETLEAETIGE